MYIHFSSLFSSDVTTRCSNYIFNYASITPSVTTNNSNRGSYFVNRWLSPKDLHKSTDGSLSYLLQEILLVSSRCRVYLVSDTPKPLSFHSCWAMISSSGFEGEAHCHSGSISGVLYLDSGASSSHEGALIFYSANGEPIKKITPCSGDLVLFPSSQIHSVSAYNSPIKRVILSFNII